MKNLRNKMIRTVFLSVMTVFIILSIICYCSMSLYFSNQADNLTNLIAMSDDFEIPEKEEYTAENKDILFHFGDETSNMARYFVVYMNENGDFQKWDKAHISAASATYEEAYAMATSAIHRQGKTGYVNDYRYRIINTNHQSAFVVIFLNCGENLFLQHLATLFILLLAIVFTMLVTIVFTIFSNHFMKPFEENSRRQKQFITDASHELKTPLSIISANAQVLEFKTGSNDWINNIVSQTERMSTLINELLMLAKSDEVDNDLLLEQVDYAQLISKTIEQFQEVAHKKKVTISLNVPPENTITLYACREQLQQLVSILTENATKYVTENGKITITLTANKRYATLRIFNTADIPADIDCSRLFDRFFRPDNSRTSSTGGHGIGLSIAKKITTQHDGTIDAKQENGGICFSAVVSRTLKPKQTA